MSKGIDFKISEVTASSWGAELKGFIETKYHEKLNVDNLKLVDRDKIVIDKPEIPQFVADWIENKAKELPYVHNLEYRSHIVGYYFKYIGMDKIKEYAPKEVVNWLSNGKIHDFMVAIITGEYQIEEEPKYYVVDSKGVLLLVKDNKGKRTSYVQDLERAKRVLSDLSHYQFTEQEIKDYDKRYWAFAEPVEEEL